jgi:hypothetical protein
MNPQERFRPKRAHLSPDFAMLDIKDVCASVYDFGFWIFPSLEEGEPGILDY